MSDIYFKCLCGKSLAVDIKGVGRTITCPDCKQKLQIPESTSQLQCECGISILVPDSMMGDTVQCLSCKKYWQVPSKQVPDGTLPSKQEDVLRDHEPPEKGSVQINLKLGASFFVKALIALVVIVAISVFFSVKRHKKPTLSVSLIGGSSEQAGAVTNKQAVAPQTQAEVVVSNKINSNAINNQAAESQIKAVAEPAKISVPVVAGVSESSSELRKNGAFAFPQQDAKVLCDRPDLRFSVWNNDKYLFAQAVMWNDGDASLGKIKDNREIGDWANVELDLDADGKATPKADRSYSLNPWPKMPGLHYTICMGERSTTGLQSDSKGRGAISYVETSEGKKVRVDTYLIPMAEISRHVGEKIRICYWGYSPKPLLTVNSAGYEGAGKEYYSYNIPRSQYHEYDLAKGGEIDAAKIPEGRNIILTVENAKPITVIATPVAPAAVKSVTFEQLVAAQSTGESQRGATNKVESMQVTTTSDISDKVQTAQPVTNMTVAVMDIKNFDNLFGSSGFSVGFFIERTRDRG